MDLIINNNVASWGKNSFPCVYGRHGFTDTKCEGDQKTPFGEFPFRAVYYRKDRITLPPTKLKTHIITPACGWCDAPESPHYNQYVKKPFSSSHEDLWMEQDLYDIFITVGQNDTPAIPGKGSAIFIHLTPESGYTAGCIGIKKPALLNIIETADSTSRLIVQHHKP